MQARRTVITRCQPGCRCRDGIQRTRTRESGSPLEGASSHPVYRRTRQGQRTASTGTGSRNLISGGGIAFVDGRSRGRNFLCGLTRGVRSGHRIVCRLSCCVAPCVGHSGEIGSARCPGWGILPPCFAPGNQSLASRGRWRDVRVRGLQTSVSRTLERVEPETARPERR